MRKIIITAAMVLADLMSPAHAQDGVKAPVRAPIPSPAPSLGARDPNASPFLQCDGATGHVGTGEMVARLVALTATAGFSEFGTRNDDPSKRVFGTPGAAACDAALAQEGNKRRRAALALARTVHLIEAEQFEAALVSARQVPVVAEIDTDWGMKHMIGPAAALFEANILLRLGRSAEAEDVAMRGGLAAGMDVIGMVRFVSYASLTDRMTEDKRAFLTRAERLVPVASWQLLEARAQTGDFAGASRYVAAAQEANKPFLPNPEEWFAVDALQAVYAVMAGDTTTAATLTASSRATMADMIAAGKVARSAPNVTVTDERHAFVDIALQRARGDAAGAQRAFAARGNWLQVPASARIALAEQLRAVGPLREGLLAVAPADQRSEERAARAALLTHASRTPYMYAIAKNYMADSKYERAASMVWRIGDKPYFLVRRRGNVPRLSELVDVMPKLLGNAGGEALLLHCALIAQSRGMDGFVIPRRTVADIASVRFGKIGTPGFPDMATLNAAQVIAELSPHMPRPVQSR